jgi:dihydrofolate reductase
MVQLTSDLFISLDGCAALEEAGPFFGYGGPQLQEWIDRELSLPQVLLFGRNTFEMFASMMSVASDASSARVCELPKLVVSSTLTEPLTWAHSRLLHGDVVVTIPEEKRTSTIPLRTMGSVSLVRSLLSAGLVDRLRLMIFPLACRDRGSERLFDHGDLVRFDLLNTTVLDSRVVLLEYSLAAPNE